MLQTLHDRLKGWLAYVVLGAIALVFVFWGINWTFGTKTYAAKVNHREIPVDEIREIYQARLNEAQRAGDGQLSEERRAAIKQAVLDQYVGTEALLARLRDLGYRVSDQQLREALERIPAFQVNGKFDAAQAVNLLRMNGRSIADLESQIRRSLETSQLVDALSESNFATQTELQRLMDLQHQQRELTWLVLPAQKYIAAATPDAAALSAYYTAHKSAYMTPDTVTLRYVELNLADLAAHVEVTDAQLREYFDEQKAKNPQAYSQGEQRRVSHILIQADKDDAAAKAKAEEIANRAKAGEDFAALAKKYSQDPGSAAQGGDLGFSDRKGWVTAFSDAAFSMQPKEIRGPVKTQFGYHILKLIDIRAATEKTFEQMRPALESEYRRGQAEKLFNDVQDQLTDAVLQSGQDIDAVAKKAGLPVKEIKNFSKVTGGAELGAPRKLLEAVFSADVLDGHLSQIIQLDQNRAVIVHATDHRLPQQESLADVQSEVLVAVKAEQGKQQLADAAAAALKTLQSGASWDSVGQSYGVTPVAPKFYGRADETAPIEIRMQAFEAPKPSDKPQYLVVQLPSGDMAVVGYAAQRIDPAPVSPEQQAAVRRQYAQSIAAGEAESYAQAARAAATIVENPAALD